MRTGISRNLVHMRFVLFYRANHVKHYWLIYIYTIDEELRPRRSVSCNINGDGNSIQFNSILRCLSPYDYSFPNQFVGKLTQYRDDVTLLHNISSSFIYSSVWQSQATELHISNWAPPWYKGMRMRIYELTSCIWHNLIQILLNRCWR